MTANELADLISQRHSGSAWAFLREVPNGTGMAKTRSADAMAVSLWRSKGLNIYGYEIKVSRSDWLREIQQPEKAAAFSRYCHYWNVVAPAGVVRLEEMPADWGLMEPAKNGLRVKKAATLRQPDPIDYHLLAGLLRAALKERGADEQEQALKAEFAKGLAQGEAIARHEADHKTRVQLSHYDRLLKSVAAFEHAAGIKIDEYCGGPIGADFRAYQDFRKTTDRVNRLTRWRNSLANVARDLAVAIENCDTLLGEKEATRA